MARPASGPCRAGRAPARHPGERGAAGEARRPADLRHLLAVARGERGAGRDLPRRPPRFLALPCRARLGRNHRRPFPGRRRLSPPDPRPPRHRRLLRRLVRARRQPRRTFGIAIMTATAQDKILILDFGSQVTQLIARRVRENGVYCEIHPYTAGEERIREFAPAGVILSGGPASVTVATTPRAPDIVFRLGVPVLAICYGMQTMCAQLGGRVTLSDHQEFGRAFIEVTGDCLLFEGLWPRGAREQVWMSHGDRIDALPSGLRPVAVSDGAPYAAVADDERRRYGVLFHPEVVHTPQGGKLLRNFTHHVCGIGGDWTMAAFRAQAVERIRQ